MYPSLEYYLAKRVWDKIAISFGNQYEKKYFFLLKYSLRDSSVNFIDFQKKLYVQSDHFLIPIKSLMSGATCFI